MIHRDIKPSNILLDKDGTAKLLDVGLARVRTPVPNQESNLTTTGLTMGTVDFMAPEQARNTRLADERSDIYSIGCTLHFLLTGRPPYGVGTGMERLLAHREQTIPDLREMNDSVPDALQRLLSRCLAKDPALRFASCTELVDRLARVTEHGIPDITLPLTEPVPPDLTIQETVKPSEFQATVAMLSTADITAAPAQVELDAQQELQSAGRPPTSKRLKAVVAIVLIGFVAVYLLSDPETSNDVPQQQNLTQMSTAEVQTLRDDWSAHASDAASVDLLGIHFTLIPPGESEFANAHQTFSKPFYMATTEVTVDQFRQFVQATGYESESRIVGGYGYSSELEGWQISTDFGWDNLGDVPVSGKMPATSITYNDAEQFCIWASRESNRTIRLPNETEWEFACRCGRAGTWFFGNDPDEIDRYAWISKNANQLKEVGLLSGNAWGLFDMLGNEWEWCHSEILQPQRMAVLRGGGFEADANGCENNTRHPQQKSDPTHGAFRVLLESQ